MSKKPKDIIIRIIAWTGLIISGIIMILAVIIAAIGTYLYLPLHPIIYIILMVFAILSLVLNGLSIFFWLATKSYGSIGMAGLVLAIIGIVLLTLSAAGMFTIIELIMTILYFLG